MKKIGLYIKATKKLKPTNGIGVLFSEVNGFLISVNVENYGITCHVLDSNKNFIAAKEIPYNDILPQEVLDKLK